jgi:NAD(P) transhydrogenase subunit alpha
VVRTIFVPKEKFPGETRIPMVPEAAQKLSRLGTQLLVEKGLGLPVGYADQEYEQAGATVVDAAEGYQQADCIFHLRKPTTEDIEPIKPGSMLVGFLEPFDSQELIAKLQDKQISAVAMEFIPRTTIAQKMDALSSQANLSGYVSVILAANHLQQALPMMMTPSGTIKPARVFIVGVGVAGLQAIATAKRLGARVDAFDTRPVVEEQVKSLGAKFLKIDLGETGQTKDGYAKALTDEQLARQREAMGDQCKLSDIVITAAQVFGRKAPVIINQDMLKKMRPGSVVVDTAMESGGNVEGSQPDEIVDADGVKIIGYRNLPGRVAKDASQMYANNLVNFFSHFWDKEANTFQLNLDDDIIKNSLLTHEGTLVSERLKASQQ